MIRSEQLEGHRDSIRSQLGIGPLGHLGLFVSSLGLILLAPQSRILPAAAACLVLASFLHRDAIRSCLRVRWLVLMALLALPPVLVVGEMDRTLLGISYSSEGLLVGVQIGLRMLVIMVAVQGFTASVDITSIAGLFERLGLHGLGFSLGVALNLLPVLQDSAAHTWHSLWMRGGLRRYRWRGLQLLLITIMTNALRRAEEIALAAECRAFSPQLARAFQIETGRFDRAILILGPLAVLASRLGG